MTTAPSGVRCRAFIGQHLMQSASSQFAGVADQWHVIAALREAEDPDPGMAGAASAYMDHGAGHFAEAAPVAPFGVNQDERVSGWRDVGLILDWL